MPKLVQFKVKERNVFVFVRFKDSSFKASIMMCHSDMAGTMLGLRGKVEGLESSWIILLVPEDGMLP